MAKTALTFIGGALALWAGAGLLLWRWQEKLIFIPRSTPPEIARELSDMQIFVPAADKAVLRGWQHPGNSAAPASDCKLVIYFGGNSEEVSHHVSENGSRFSCPQWYVNYRGFGQSDGKPSAEALRADALQIVDHAAQQTGIAISDMCVFGRSLGTHMAAHIAAHRPIKKLVMVTPFDSVLNIARSRYPIFPVRHMLRHQFDTLAEAPQITAPALFLLAERDFVVPHARATNLIANWSSPHTALTIPGTSHNQMETPGYWRAIETFLSPEDGEL